MLEKDSPKWKWLENRREERKRLEHVAHDFEKTSDEEIATIVDKIAKELEKNHGEKENE